MKEWKENNRAGIRILGIKTDHTTKGREKDDFYATDPVALEKLLDHCSLFLENIFNSCRFPRDFRYENMPHFIRKNGQVSEWPVYIWECAVGTGNLADVLQARELQVVWTDLKDRGYGKWRGMYNYDFLKTGQEFLWKYNVGVILTNPPYSLANEFAEHALEILPDNGLYIALMNLQYLSGQKRYDRIYKYGSLREVYIFSKRVECWKNNTPSGHSSMANYAWYVFQKGYKGQPTLYWL